MNILIFAGGTGTRLWPLSRKNSPKQFEKIFNGKSTLQLTVDRIAPTFGFDNIYISTNEKYVSIVKQQLPQIPSHNIIGEPEKRDVAAAIGYNLMRLKKAGYKGPVVILWSDHLLKQVDKFLWALKEGEKIVRDDARTIVFIGNQARYAEPNLGWIHLGNKIQEGMYDYKGLVYRPLLEECQKMFQSGEWVWNLGYWILDLDYTLNLYKKYAPEMYTKLEIIKNAVGTVDEMKVLRKVYSTLESISFDNAILEKLDKVKGVVITADMKWSDPGTLYALKEALQKGMDENVIKGDVFPFNTKDCLIFNYEQNKLVTAVGLNGCIIINMEDALLVVKKEDVPSVKKLVEALEKNGLENFI